MRQNTVLRRTKIICTIGPATNNRKKLENLYMSGMNIVRLNMSHGTLEEHKKIIDDVKKINNEAKYPIAVLLDTQGPEIRTGTLDQELEIKEGQRIWVSVRTNDVEQSSFFIEYEELIDSLGIGDLIRVDNGLINLEVLSKKNKQLECLVIDGGILKSKRHVNLPGVRVNLPALTQKDKRDIRFGLEQGVDFIALSFVRQAVDIKQLKDILVDEGKHVKIIAKIEDQQGLDNLEEIVEEADGVMIARGDLGVEIPIEDLPNVQRIIGKACHRKGKRIIVATHMLESMIMNPIPTRAEVTDIANAVYEGVDAVMLSGETAVGKYPEKSVQMLDKVVRKSEHIDHLLKVTPLLDQTSQQGLALAGVDLAERISASGIVVMTRTGIVADLVTNARPFQVPIFTFTNNIKVMHDLSLNRSVFPYLMDFDRNPEDLVQIAINLLLQENTISIGNEVVVISEPIQGQSDALSLEVRKV